VIWGVSLNIDHPIKSVIVYLFSLVHSRDPHWFMRQKNRKDPNRRNTMSVELTYRGVTYVKKVKATSGVVKASK